MGRKQPIQLCPSNIGDDYPRYYVLHYSSYQPGWKVPARFAQPVVVNTDQTERLSYFKSEATLLEAGQGKLRRVPTLKGVVHG